MLPSIRKIGSYTANPSNKMELALDDMKIVYAQINNMEDLLAEQNEKLDRVVDNLTLSTRQQQKIYKVAKDRVNHLLGGTRGTELTVPAGLADLAEQILICIAAYIHCLRFVH